ncbi:MAG: glycosyltransferase family 2 protein [Planctomycetota bacterium]
MRTNKTMWPCNCSPGWMPEAFEPGLVSVIVPTYNRARFLSEAMDSVLAQSYRPVVLIVVDDGSTDGTHALLRRWGRGLDAEDGFTLRFLQQEHAGAPAARNRGLVESRGEFIQFLDSDDLLHPKKLETQARVLASDGACDFVCSGTALFEDVPEQTAEPVCGTRRARLLPDFVNELLWQTGSGLYRRSACVAVGPWHEELRRWQDWEYNVRFAAMRPNVRYAAGTLSFFRQHGHGRIDDLGQHGAGIRSGQKAATLVERHLRRAGLEERVIGCAMTKRYYRLATEAMEAREADLVRAAFAAAARVDACLLCKAKVALAKASYAALGAGSGSRLLGIAGRAKRLLVRGARGSRSGVGFPAPQRSPRAPSSPCEEVKKR